MKTHINPSSIGSYFGVGFNTPDEQFQIDLGEIEQEFDDDAKSRLRLGEMLEDASLNYFEETFGVIIDDRNESKRSFYGGKIIGKIDGACVLNDIPTVVENKISNAESYKFTNSLGYMFQCQCYMIDNEFQQALLCGLYKGKPTYKIIARDEEIIKDIKEMADFVVNCLMGLSDFTQDFPNHLYEKYSKKQTLPLINDINESSKNLIERYAEIKTKLKEIEPLEKEAKMIEDELKETYSSGVIDNEKYKITLQSQTREGSLDVDALMIDYPEINISQYKKPATTYNTLRFTFKKGK